MHLKSYSLPGLIGCSRELAIIHFRLLVWQSLLQYPHPLLQQLFYASKLRGKGWEKGKKKHLKIPDGFFMASVLCADEGCMDLFAS